MSMKNKIECLRHDIADLTESDNLYIIKVSNKYGCELLKLGYSYRLRKRMISYFSHNPFIEIVFTSYRNDGLEFEKWFHRNNLSEYKNEWYSIEMLYFMIQSIFEITGFNSSLQEKLIVKPREKPDYVNVSVKACNTCKEIKDASFFHKDVWRKTGLRDNCKECCKIKNKHSKDKKIKPM